MRIDWTWLLIGIALGWFLVPAVMAMIGRKKAPVAAA